MLETGIPRLDRILGGGLREGDSVLVAGPSGSGKTTLCLQTAFHLARQGRNVIYASTLSEPPTRVLEHVRSFTFYDEDLVGNRLFLVSLWPLLEQGMPKILEALSRVVKERQATLLIIDGLMTFHDLFPETQDVRRFIYQLGSVLTTLGATVLLTTTAGQDPVNPRYPEYTIVDGTIELEQHDEDSRTLRSIHVRKLRGQEISLGAHALGVGWSGISVFPRLESIYRVEDRGLEARRVPLGLPELDAMMEGGPLAGSVTLLAGTLGTGKTLSCLQYLLEGVRRGEQVLFAGSRETPAQLIDKARLFGLDLVPALREGQLDIFFRPAVDMVADEFMWDLLEQLDRARPQRLSLDNVADLERAVGERRGRDGFMAALAGTLRDRNITSLISKEVAQVAGPELDFSQTPLAALAENMILMRWVEYRGELYRIISVLKMRDSAHDRSIRQYTISSQGLKVLARPESGERLLTGIARLPAERRVKRQAPEAGSEED